MIRAGELREKIQIQRPVRVANDSGGFDTVYETILNTFAMVVEDRSNPNLVASQENIYNYVHFKIRYRPEIFLKIADKIDWRGNNFIVNNIKVDYLRTQIDIYVNSDIESSQRQGFEPLQPVEPISLQGFPYTLPITLE